MICLLAAGIAGAGAHAADPVESAPVLSAGVDHRWQREPSPGCTTSSATVRLVSAEAARAVGFEFARVEPGPVDRAVDRTAKLAYNSNRYARLSSRAPGVVAEVKVDLGETVTKGDVLALVDSTDLGDAKSDLLQALESARLWEANAAREKALLERGVGVEREAFEAQTKAAESRIAVNRARQRLRNLGLSKEQVAAVEAQGDSSSLLEVIAPFDGRVVERSAVLGEVAEPARPLFAVADTATMWAIVDLSEPDLATVAIGLPATITIDGLPGRDFSGRLTWISTEIDARTRTVKARVELDNAEGLLRANMFGRARIHAGENRRALTVPKDAVQWEGCCNIAFVKANDEGTLFRPARLLLSYDAGDRYEVADGLNPGDAIVTSGSHILKNEILKNSVGAGCCEVDHLAK
jgi:cobalt-zinc-cadmium efflux system membrane fusion protein